MKKTPLDIIREAELQPFDKSTDDSVGSLLPNREANTRHSFSNLGTIQNGITVWGMDEMGAAHFSSLEITRFLIRDGTETVGSLSLRADPSVENGARIIMAYVMPQYRHQGVGEAFYSFVIHRGVALISDDQISPMALSVWRKLARDPSIKIGLQDHEGNIDYEGDPIEKVLLHLADRLVATSSGLTEDAQDSRQFYNEIKSHVPAFGKLEYKPEIANWPPSAQEWRELERSILQTPEWIAYWARYGWTSWTNVNGPWYFNPHKSTFSFYDVPELSYFHDQAEPYRGLLEMDIQGNVIVTKTEYSHFSAFLPSAIAVCRDKVKEAQPKLQYLKGGYYIRFGAWPKNERSRNWIVRDQEVFEKGVSAYHANYDLDTNLWEIDLSISEESISGTLESLIMGNRPIFLVRGDEIKEEGADGEPLLRNVKLIKQLQKGEVIVPGIFEQDDILE